jgi:hypothetical protein
MGASMANSSHGRGNMTAKALHEEAKAHLRRLQKDTRYFEAHQEELLRQYPEQWVAILDQEVLGTASDFEQLLDALKQKGVPLGQVLFKHLTEKEELWVLSS